MLLKGQFTPKFKFCHHLLNLMSFQTCMLHKKETRTGLERHEGEGEVKDHFWVDYTFN